MDACRVHRWRGGHSLAGAGIAAIVLGLALFGAITAIMLLVRKVRQRKIELANKEPISSYSKDVEVIAASVGTTI
jgi:hypothetical protein